jgi:hypothetical protein
VELIRQAPAKEDQQKELFLLLKNTVIFLLKVAFLMRLVPQIVKMGIVPIENLTILVKLKISAEPVEIFQNLEGNVLEFINILMLLLLNGVRWKELII